MSKIAFLGLGAMGSRMAANLLRAGHELTGGEQYRQLAEEYRRLADMAITAQEHTELKLTELAVQVDEVCGKLDRMQRILDEVE